MNLPKRLQGTDGIRGKVCTNEQFPDLQPLAVFLEKDYLTPAFFELYCYAYASLLLQTGFANEQDTLVIGWDPRDTEGKFRESAVAGIRKAGLKVVQVGISPTPAIALYMLTIRAVGSVVLTASHNPADQNGIKLFHGFTGLKFLPADDEELTKHLYEKSKADISALELVGEVEDHSDSAKKCFIDFSLSPKNSWMMFTTDTSSTILFVDASKGALSSVVNKIFSHFDFHEVIYTNVSHLGDVNEHCGVGDLEGKDQILPEEVLPKNAFFHPYETLLKMFERGQLEKEAGGNKKISGLVFDGDGDRCFRLDYVPEQDRILISSGDYLGVHQALFLKKMGVRPKHSSAWFVNTVESDLQTGIFAESEGYQAVLTAVGDKWILLKAILDQCKASLEQFPEPEMSDFLETHAESPMLSGRILSDNWRKLENKLTKTAINTQYLIGFEESGHCITPGFYSSEGKQKICFLGNGIKTGLNSFAAIDILWREKETKEYFSVLEHPYPPGIKTTLYVYYVDKSRLELDHPFSKELQEYWATLFTKVFEAEYTFKQKIFHEESSLLYFEIFQNEQRVGAVFIRNSGTEDKSTLYLRGIKEIESYLIQIGTKLHLYLLQKLKNNKNELAILEKTLLNQISEKNDLEEVKRKFVALPVDRVLKEMEIKEGLIQKKSSGIAVTDKGRQLLSSWSETK